MRKKKTKRKRKKEKRNNRKKVEKERTKKKTYEKEKKDTWGHPHELANPAGETWGTLGSNFLVILSLGEP